MTHSQIHEVSPVLEEKLFDAAAVLLSCFEDAALGSLEVILS